MLTALRARGLEPVITLMHFSYPAWLDADGGWENPKAAQRFARYAAFISREFGQDIKVYLTYNEPNIFLMGAYLVGMLPPGKRNPLAGSRALRNMITGHRLAYAQIHANDKDAKVSFNMYTAEYTFGFQGGVEQTPEQQAKERITSNMYFMDEAVKAAPGSGSTMDFAAFDYYCKFKVTLPFAFPRADTWEVYPEGFYQALKAYHEHYKLPVLVAENGLATWDGARRQDRWNRASYIVAHVKAMQRAMAGGVPVMGYIHWSITDNYEWGSFSPHFGLFTVDCRNKDFRRVPTEGVNAYADVIKAGGVTEAILKKYPPPGILPLPVPWQPGGGTHVGTK
jgi:beta-glucosidase